MDANNYFKTKSWMWSDQFGSIKHFAKGLRKREFVFEDHYAAK